MSASRVLQRWNRWALLLLLVLNALLWAPFALSARHFRISAAAAAAAGCRALSPR